MICTLKVLGHSYLSCVEGQRNVDRGDLHRVRDPALRLCLGHVLLSPWLLVQQVYLVLVSSCVVNDGGGVVVKKLLKCSGTMSNRIILDDQPTSHVRQQ
jgi:hypothetical protein